MLLSLPPCVDRKNREQLVVDDDCLLEKREIRIKREQHARTAPELSSSCSGIDGCGARSTRLAGPGLYHIRGS